VDPETFARLLTPSGGELVARAAEAYAEAAGDPVRAAAALRRGGDGGDPDLAAAAMGQAALRAKGRVKLGEDAERMWFTSEGLEQATRTRVAQHRAARVAAWLSPTPTGSGSVLDAGCGIGGDLIALARAGVVVAGVDTDPLRVAVAQANLRALDLPGAVRVADATTLDLSGFDVVFTDPARRTARGRTFDPDAYVPPWSWVERLLTRPACAKVAPGIPHERVPLDAEAEWVSLDGEVKEAVLWSRDLAVASRRATVVRGAGLATLTEADDPGPVGVRPPGRFLLEPDGAVIRAGLVTAVAGRVEGWLLDEHIAYVSTDQPPEAGSPLARGYEVLERLPYQEKQLRAALRARGVGRLTIKKRGVAVAPEQLRARLALKGDAEATLVLTRVSGKGTALLVRPLAAA
jgi:SAM-dependent methyltransferase